MTTAEYEVCSTEGDPEFPVHPDGAGWRLVTAIDKKGSYDQVVIWFWEREVPPKRNPKKKSV